MEDHNKSSDVAPEAVDRKTQLKQLSGAFQIKIKAENAALKSERNARRWKEERDPIAYEAQKVAQREEYAEQIAHTQGRQVRDYVPVVGQDHSEREEVRRNRKAAADAKRTASQTQDEKDAKADRKWLVRQVKAGKTEEQCKAGMAKRLTDRKLRVSSYKKNPSYGQF